MEINVTFSFDDNYCQHAAALIMSILDNASEEDFYNFYIFYSESGLSKSNRKRLKKLFKKYECNLIFKIINNKKERLFEKFKDFIDHIGSKAALYRLISFDEIPEKKIIYLDVDTIVKKNLGNLYKKKLGTNIIGAIPDYILGKKKGRDYLNSGVILINLEKWKKEDCSEKCLKMIKNRKFKYLDQDALNKIFKNNWKGLPLEYNRQKILFEYTPQDLDISKEKYKELLKNPSIIHYTGPIKPWHFKYVFPDKKDYIKNLNKTPWKNKINEDLGIKSLIFYILRWPIYKLKMRKLIEKLNLVFLTKYFR